jgi:hypothetical protein
MEFCHLRHLKNFSLTNVTVGMTISYKYDGYQSKSIQINNFFIIIFTHKKSQDMGFVKLN